MKLNQFISFYRKTKGFTQDSLANELNVSSNTLCQYETGTRNIPSDIIEKLCNVLNFSILVKPKNKNVIRIIFENDEIEKFIHEQVKKFYNININFAINYDDEYPDVVYFEIYEEDNDEKEILSLTEKFGDNVLENFMTLQLLCQHLLCVKEIRAWNIGKEHEGNHEYGEEFRTVIEFDVER